MIPQTSCVKVDDDLPLEKAVLVGCGVPTGWGSAVYAADVAPGETVIVYGIGGIGINAVQGARYAGAKNVIAVDPLANKRETARSSAPPTRSRPPRRRTSSHQELTRGVGADKAIITVGLVDRRGRRRGVQRDPQGRHGGHHRPRRPDEPNIQLPGAVLTL